MNKKITHLFLSLTLLFLASPVFADKVENPLKGINTFPQLLEKIALVVGGIVGSLAVVMLIVSGIYFLLSAGSPNMLGRAKSSLTYAVIGGAVALAAAGIVALLKAIIGA